MKRFLILIPFLFLIGCKSSSVSEQKERIIGKNSNLIYEKVFIVKDGLVGGDRLKEKSFKIFKEDVFVINFCKRIGGNSLYYKHDTDCISLNNSSGYFNEIDEKIPFYAINHTPNTLIIEDTLKKAANDFCPNAKVSFDGKIKTSLDGGNWYVGYPETIGFIECTNLINENMAIKNQKELELKNKEKEKEEKEKLDTMLAKQETCESLGFEIGTPSNGDCVLKLLELETQVAASTQTIINNNSGSDQATVNALAETQQKMLIQQQSQALINMGASLLNSGQPKINCRQTLTGFSCY